MSNSAFRAVSSANQAVAANTTVKVLYPVQQFDKEREYNPATSTFTADDDGVYLVIGSVSFDANNNAVSYRATIQIRVNGVPFVASDNDFFGPIASTNVVSISSIIRLNERDTVEIFFNPGTDGNIRFNDNAGIGGTHFEAASF